MNTGEGCEFTGMRVSWFDSVFLSWIFAIAPLSFDVE
jgi:hypothetical protein